MSRQAAVARMNNNSMARRSRQTALGLVVLAAAATTLPSNRCSAFSIVGGGGGVDVGRLRRRMTAASTTAVPFRRTFHHRVAAEGAAAAGRSPLFVSVAPPPDASSATGSESDDAEEEEEDRRPPSTHRSSDDAEKEDEQPHSHHSPPKRRTKRQIAQLRYVMINDVESMMRSSDAADRSAAPDRARENIDRLERLREETGDDAYSPTADMYNSLVRAHAKSGGKDAGRMAEEVLEAMREEGKSGSGGSGNGGDDMRPDVTTYTAVIDALAHSTARDAPVRAERILFRMMDEAEEAAKLEAAGLSRKESSGGGDGSIILPTSVTCDAVLNAWARRGSREGAERAEKILTSLRQPGECGAPMTEASTANDAKGERWRAREKGSITSRSPVAKCAVTSFTGLAMCLFRGGHCDPPSSPLVEDGALPLIRR